MSVGLIWITPNAEDQIVHIARVSNPDAQAQGHDPKRLIRYLVKHLHWSPFEMASACLEIQTTRDIARQILRHRSFSFQEFSQRYASIGALPELGVREARLQDPANRQASREVEDADLHGWWNERQDAVRNVAISVYSEALQRGIAKEQARSVLPEGLTPSRIYMAGTVRSWLHYCAVRCGKETQKEHRLIAQAARDVLAVQMPTIFGEACHDKG